MTHKALFACTAAVLGFLALGSDGDKALKSGLQLGERTSPFQTRDITGPNKGKSLCYVWQYGTRPVVLTFAREINPTLTSLVKAVDKAVVDNKEAKLASFVVFLTDKSGELEPKVAELANKEGIKNVPLTIVENIAGPEKYKVAKDADVTVVLYTKGETKANFAFKKGELTDDKVKEVAAAVSKITAK